MGVVRYMCVWGGKGSVRNWTRSNQNKLLGVSLLTQTQCMLKHANMQ